MTRDELLQLINIKEELIATGKQNRPGVIIRPSKITIHNTSNTNAGANADMHSRFVRNTGFYIITPATELYDKDEPLEVVLGDNETHRQMLESASPSNIVQYI